MAGGMRGCTWEKSDAEGWILRSNVDRCGGDGAESEKQRCLKGTVEIWFTNRTSKRTTAWTVEGPARSGSQATWEEPAHLGSVFLHIATLLPSSPGLSFLPSSCFFSSL